MESPKTEHLRRLHFGPRLLVLPNAWDVASARIFEDAGFPAIGTTSAGIAASLGYPDGQRIPRGEMLSVVARIARAVSVPVTADVEAAYGLTVQDVVATARAVVESGAVGLNLEDVTGDDENGLVDIALQMEKIQAIHDASAEMGVPLVINARTDIYLLGIGDPATRLARTVQRLNGYRQAGADCLFAPAVRDAETIDQLVRKLDGPLNVLAGPGMPAVAELERLGVARMSVGSGPMRATLGLTQRIAKELREEGACRLMLEGAMPYAEMNALFRSAR